jgi:hypothetical protein
MPKGFCKLESCSHHGKPGNCEASEKHSGQSCNRLGSITQLVNCQGGAGVKTKNGSYRFSPEIQGAVNQKWVFVQGLAVNKASKPSDTLTVIFLGVSVKCCRPNPYYSKSKIQMSIHPSIFCGIYFIVAHIKEHRLLSGSSVHPWLATCMSCR